MTNVATGLPPRFVVAGGGPRPYPANGAVVIDVGVDCAATMKDGSADDPWNTLRLVALYWIIWLVAAGVGDGV